MTMEVSRCDEVEALSRRQRPVGGLLTGLAETFDMEELWWFSVGRYPTAHPVSQGSRAAVTLSTNCETGAAATAGWTRTTARRRSNERNEARGRGNGGGEKRDPSEPRRGERLSGLSFHRARSWSYPGRGRLSEAHRVVLTVPVPRIVRYDTCKIPSCQRSTRDRLLSRSITHLRTEITQ